MIGAALTLGPFPVATTFSVWTELLSGTRVDMWSSGDENDECVARFNFSFAWERGADPLSHPYGQCEHLDKVDSKCFPVQTRVKIPTRDDNRETDRRLLKKQKERLYSAQDVEDMLVAGDANTTSDNKQTYRGEEPLKLNMIVFGNKPGEKKLKQLAQANLRDLHSFEGRQDT